MNDTLFEERLTAGLSELAARADVPALEPHEFTVASASQPDQQPKRRGRWLAAAAALALAGVGITAYAVSSGPGDGLQQVAADGTENSTTEDSTTEDSTTEDSATENSAATTAQSDTQGDPVSTADLAGAERAVATVVPEGFELILSVDNSDMGQPWYENTNYLWAMPENAADSPDTGSILMTLADSSPLPPGEPIDIAGLEGVLIDNVAANTSSDLVVTTSAGTATFDGANVPIGDVIRLATSWVDSGLADPPEILDNGMQLRLTAEGVGWRGFGGPSGVTGTPEGSTVIYQDPDDRTRVLGVQSSPIEGSGGVEYVRWLFPEMVSDVEIEGVQAVIFQPVPGYTAVRFESGDRLIVVWGENLTVEEVVASAESLRAAMDDEWGVGL